MGPLMVSIPRNKYRGAFSNETPSSKLISATDDNMECEIIASQMATRLSQQLQMAIFVACSLDDAAVAPPMGLDGTMERHMLRRRAAVHAEKRICHLLKGNNLPVDT
jgi:hypothetical protein